MSLRRAVVSLHHEDRRIVHILSSIIGSLEGEVIDMLNAEIDRCTGRVEILIVEYSIGYCGINVFGPPGNVQDIVVC